MPYIPNSLADGDTSFVLSEDIGLVIEAVSDAICASLSEDAFELEYGRPTEELLCIRMELLPPYYKALYTPSIIMSFTDSIKTVAGRLLHSEMGLHSIMEVLAARAIIACCAIAVYKDLPLLSDLGADCAPLMLEDINILCDLLFVDDGVFQLFDERFNKQVSAKGKELPPSRWSTGFM